MKIGIIGPSKLKSINQLSNNLDKIKSIAKTLADLDHEIIITPDKGSLSEFFAQEYSKHTDKKPILIVPLNDKEFGYSHLNLDLGENINCETWRNQPEKLNEESEILLCIGYSTGGLIEIAYSKWFNPKKVLIFKEFISQPLPEDATKELNIKYISINEFKENIK